MKRIINSCLTMVYPSLISLFIFVFATAFVKGEKLEIIQLISFILSLLFGLIFLVFFIVNIVYSIRHKSDE